MLVTLETGGFQVGHFQDGGFLQWVPCCSFGLKILCEAEKLEDF